MPDMLRRPIMWILFGATAAYWVAAQFMIPRRIIVLMDSMVITTALSVMIVYSKALVGRLSSENPTALDMMIIGITGGWLVNAIDRGIRLVARVLGWDDLINHQFLGYLLAMMAVFACFHLLVRNVDKEGPWTTTKAWGVIVVAVILGAALGSFSLTIDRAYHGD